MSACMNVTDATESACLQGGPQSVTGANLFWALLAISMNTMGQSSLVVDVFSNTAAQLENALNPCLSSPIVCLVDILIESSILLRVCWRSIRHAPIPRQPSFGDSTSETSEASQISRTVIAVRLGLFFFAVLPQAVKIFSMQGIPATQVLAMILLLPSLLRVLSLMTRRSVEEKAFVMSYLKTRIGLPEDSEDLHSSRRFLLNVISTLGHVVLYAWFWQSIASNLVITPSDEKLAKRIDSISEIWFAVFATPSSLILLSTIPWALGHLLMCRPLIRAWPFRTGPQWFIWPLNTLAVYPTFLVQSHRVAGVPWLNKLRETAPPIVAALLVSFGFAILIVRLTQHLSVHGTGFKGSEHGSVPASISLLAEANQSDAVERAMGLKKYSVLNFHDKKQSMHEQAADIFTPTLVLVWLAFGMIPGTKEAEQKDEGEDSSACRGPDDTVQGAPTGAGLPTQARTSFIREQTDLFLGSGGTSKSAHTGPRKRAMSTPSSPARTTSETNEPCGTPVSGRALLTRAKSESSLTSRGSIMEAPCFKTQIIDLAKPTQAATDLILPSQASNHQNAVDVDVPQDRSSKRYLWQCFASPSKRGTFFAGQPAIYVAIDTEPDGTKHRFQAWTLLFTKEQTTHNAWTWLVVSLAFKEFRSRLPKCIANAWKARDGGLRGRLRCTAWTVAFAGVGFLLHVLSFWLVWAMNFYTPPRLPGGESIGDLIPRLAKSVGSETLWASFAIFNLITAAGYYFVAFNDEGTVNPAWTNLLGK